MHLGHGSPRGRRSAAGFSLLEVVVAAAVLLATVTAVTFCVTSVSRSGARIEATTDADRVVRAVAGRLWALPYCAVTYPVARASQGSTPGDLVAAVFPHALPLENTAAARYVADGEHETAPAGAFITLLDEGGVEVRCVARFLAAGPGTELGPADLDGWAVAEADAPPGAGLSIVLSARTSGSMRTVRLTRTALTTPAIDGRIAVETGAAP